MARFKNPILQKNYEVMRNAARNPKSELYLADGSPHYGASHRIAYWKGRQGWGMRKAMITMHTLGHAYWAAGIDDAKEYDNV